ncbi:MAG: 5-3-deoxyribonucleotidase, partial [Adhaeribacter sp.]|nr:5-3-deoxyribonucleotidase [Adhaeribacter sp.]
PWTHIVFCGDKSILNADYLIDDIERNLVAFTGTPLVFTAPHNIHLTEYTRFDTWHDVADYFLK